MKRLRPVVRTFLGLLLGSVVLSGCDFDVYSLPLPGGTDVGDDPIKVTVQFQDVLDLVPKSTVKVNDVSVGQVKDIELDGYHAEVTLELRNDTKLPDNAIAEIRQTSLLGEKFVSLSAPETGASDEPLGDGDVIRSRPDRPQPGGRGGARRAEPDPQRRRRGPAEDDRPGAQQGGHRPRGQRPLGAQPDRHLHRQPRHQQGPDRRRDRGAQPARALGPPAGGQHRRGARGAAERADQHRRPAPGPGPDAAGPRPARPTSASG